MKWTEEMRAHVADLLRAGKSAAEIGKEMSRHRTAVISIVNRDPELRKIGFATVPGGPAWNDEEKENIAGMLRDGLTLRAIAREIGLTHNQVHGRVLRCPELHNLVQANKTARVAAPKPPKKKQNLRAGNIKSKRQARQRDPVYREPVAPIGAAEYDARCPRVSLVDHRESQCRWPLGDIREGTFAYCGHPRSWPSPYCMHHHDRSVQNRFVCAEAA